MIKECRRRSTRFPLEFPALLRWQVGRLVHTVKTSTKNISRSGLYILMKQGHQPSARVEFEVELPPSSSGESGALLRGKGHLIRREDLGDQVTGVAAAIERYEFLTTSASGGKMKLVEKSKMGLPRISKKAHTGPVLVRS